MNSAHLFSQARLTIVALRVFYCKLQGIKEIAELQDPMRQSGNSFSCRLSYATTEPGDPDCLPGRELLRHLPDSCRTRLSGFFLTRASKCVTAEERAAPTF